MALPLPRLGPKTNPPDVVDDVNHVIDEIEDTIQNVGLVGEVKIVALPAAPPGWLICDGRLISRVTYATLFSAIGVTFGAGDGQTTFALPDLRDKTVMGVSPNAGLGGVKAASTTVLKSANLPKHTHTIAHQHDVRHDHPSFNISGGSHSHTVVARTRLPGNQDVPQTNRVSGGGGTSNINNNTAVNTSSSHTHSVNVPPITVTSGGSKTASSGDGGFAATPLDITPAHVRLNHIIYAGV